MTAAKQALIETNEYGVESFFESHRRRAYQFAFQLTGEAEDAMDITQEAFLRLHRQWDKLPRGAEPAPLLFTIVRNLAVDMLRKRTTRPAAEVDEDLKDARAADPENAAMRDEVSSRLRAEIARLPLPQREALLLRDWHGLSYAEIAQVTGATVAAVTSRIHDARSALRDRMRRYL
jgi:RNA polymerase sigma-70 factor, ECF subfamily